eukprot:2644389-Lingulodinium_polyedra.AAC.1
MGPNLPPLLVDERRRLCLLARALDDELQHPAGRVHQQDRHVDAAGKGPGIAAGPRKHDHL